MASYSGWSRALPSGSSTLKSSDDQLRSHWSILEAAIKDEHYFNDGSASSAGEHKLGSARVYAGTRSQVSAAADTGRLMWTTDARQLHYIGAGGSNDTLPSLGTVNTWLSTQRFDSGLSASRITMLDTNLYRAGANHLKTDDTFEASAVSTPSITGLASLSVDTLRVGSGATITGILSFTTTIAATGVAADTYTLLYAINASGITSGNAVQIGYLDDETPPAFVASGFVDSTGSIVAVFANQQASRQTLPAQTINFLVHKTA